MTTEKARKATITIAGRDLQVLQLPDGSFAVPVPSLVSVFTDVFSLPKNAVRDLKRLLGKENSVFQVKSELHSLPVYSITLNTFKLFIVEATVRGSSIAREWSNRLMGASLESVVSHAFGIVYSQEDLVAYTSARDEHRKTFPLFTRWLHYDNPDRKDYGKQVNILKAVSNLPAVAVDDYTEEELKKINFNEKLYDRMRTKGYDHETALEFI
jgi:hypothetical protein